MLFQINNCRPLRGQNLAWFLAAAVQPRLGPWALARPKWKMQDLPRAHPWRRGRRGRAWCRAGPAGGCRGVTAAARRGPCGGGRGRASCWGRRRAPAAALLATGKGTRGEERGDWQVDPTWQKRKKGKRKNLAVGALLPYKLKTGKKIPICGEKEKREKSKYWSCSYAT